MDIVIFPENAEEVAVGIWVWVKDIDWLSNNTVGVFDIDNLIAEAVNIVGTGSVEAIFEIFTAVEFWDLPDVISGKAAVK